MKLKQLVIISLFIALEVILTRFLSIQTPIVRIGFTFIPIALSAIMFGPLLAGITAALADVVGMILFPAGVYFPGFTFSAFLRGAIFGWFLYKKPNSLWRICMPVFIITLVVNLGLDTVWLWMLTGKGIFGLLPARILKCLIMFPIQIVLIQMVIRYIPIRLIQKFP